MVIQDDIECTMCNKVICQSNDDFHTIEVFGLVWDLCKVCERNMNGKVLCLCHKVWKEEDIVFFMKQYGEIPYCGCHRDENGHWESMFD